MRHNVLKTTKKSHFTYELSLLLFGHFGLKIQIFWQFSSTDMMRKAGFKKVRDKK